MTIRQNPALKLCSDIHSDAGKKAGHLLCWIDFICSHKKKLTLILSDILRDSKKPPFLLEMTYLILSIFQLPKKYLLSFALSFSL